MGEHGPLKNVRTTTDPSDAPGLQLIGWGECPVCGLSARISADQYRGECSADCPDCEYHKTHDHRIRDRPEQEGEDG